MKKKQKQKPLSYRKLLQGLYLYHIDLHYNDWEPLMNDLKMLVTLTTRAKQGFKEKRAK